MPRRLSRFMTEGPGLAGPLRLTVVLAVTITLMVPAPAAHAHGGAFDVVVEAVNRAEGPTHLAYGIVLSFIDGHEVTGGTVTVTASTGTGSEIEVTASETTPGVYIADLTLDPGSWRVVVGIEAPDAEGSVEFPEEVGESPLTQPVVRVDTAHPERQGDTVAESSVFQPAAPPPGAETSTELRVEALVRDAVAPLIIEYGVVTDVTDASVSLSVESEESVVLGPVSLASLAPGVFSGVVEYPDAATWVVTVEVVGSGGGTARFTERLPWPHYTTEAGSPKIKVNSDDPSLEGSLIEIGASPVFGLAGTGTTSPTTVPADETTQDTPENDVVVSIPSSTAEVGRQVGLRWLHLAGIGVWAGSVAAIGLGRRRRIWAITAVGGVVATLTTGTALMLWGAPTSFPGVFSWSELGARLYGASYQVAFLIKMALVATGIVATAFLVTRSTRARLAVAAGSMLGALAAVVAMAQFHLLAHL